MTRLQQMSLWLFGMAALLSAGCGSGIEFNSVWEKEQFVFKVPVADLARLDIVNPNGKVVVVATDDAQTDIEIDVARAAAGVDRDDASRNLSAIDVYATKEGTTEKIGWRRNPPTSGDCQVKFTIKAPAKLALTINATNGDIEATGFLQPIKANATNGAIKVLQHHADANLETRNGEIVLDSTADKLRLVSYNGRITADLTKAKQIDGAIIAYNGPIGVTVGPETDTEFTCKTNNGKVDHNTKFVKAASAKGSKKRNRDPFVGVAGAGKGKLEIETKNGGIRLR